MEMRKERPLKVVFILSLLLLLIATAFITREEQLYRGNGDVVFVSYAPLETIKASSDELKGVVDPTNNSFAFTFPVSSFDGFNSPLQKEHFNEHYLETAKYEKATFSGKIIGWKNCGKDCSIQVIAKGKMSIHGITQIINVPVNIEFRGRDHFTASASFTVVLDDYEIEVPLILQSKIAPEIKVNVDVDFIKSDA